MAPKDPLGKNLTVMIAALSAFVLFAILSAATPAAFAQTTTQTATTTTAVALSTDDGLGLLAAGIAIGASCIAAGYAVGKAASSAAAAIVEKPSVFGPLLILAGLGEGIAIYGLLVAFEILSKIP